MACLLGLLRWALGIGEGLGTLVNVLWALYDLVALSVLLGAASYQGFARSGSDSAGVDGRPYSATSSTIP